MIILLFPSQESLFNFPFQHKHLIINILQIYKTIFQGTFHELTPIFQGTFVRKDNKIKEACITKNYFLR